MVTASKAVAAAAHPGVLLRVASTLHEAAMAASKAADRAATADRKVKVAANSTRCFRQCLLRSLRPIS
jgi:hypothetical protein